MSKQGQHNRISGGRVTVVVVGLLSLAAVVLLWLGSTGYWQGKLCPKAHIHGVAVGGMTKAEAEEALRDKLFLQLNKPLKFSFEAKEYPMYPWKAGITMNFTEVVEQAYQYGRQGSWPSRVADWIRGTIFPREFLLQTVVSGPKLEKWLDQVADQVYRKSLDAWIKPGKQGEFSLVKEQWGVELDRVSLQRVITTEQGTTTKSLRLPVKRIKPNVTVDLIYDYQITDLIGSFTTAFDVTNTSRSHNVSLAAQAVNGILVPPGAVFSFAYHLRSKTREADFKDAPVMVDGILVEGKGGGICQVSTTLYNAALLANLQIVERNHHSMPVTYVPIGLDATVAGDYLDLKLSHKQKRGFYISSTIQDGHLTVNLYGLKDPGCQILIEQSSLEVVEPPIKIITESTVPQGTIASKNGKQGYRISTWRIISNKGQISRELIAKDYYRPIPKVIYNRSGDT